MFLLHFLAYLVMYLKTEDETLSRMLLVFYIGQVAFFLLYIYIYRFIYRNVSRLLVNNCCMLLACGFIMLTRLSLDKGLDKAFKQFCDRGSGSGGFLAGSFYHGTVLAAVQIPMALWRESGWQPCFWYG